MNIRICSICGKTQTLVGRVRAKRCQPCRLRTTKPRLGTGDKSKPNCNGYRMIVINKKRVYEHRAVIENKIGRKLLRNEHVHHIDGNKINNSIENLEVIGAKEHMEIHIPNESRKLFGELARFMRAVKSCSRKIKEMGL